MASFLKDCTVVLSGTFPQNIHSHKSLTQWVENHGGKVVAKISEKVTHLVASPKDFDSKSAKVKQASDLSNVSIVSIEWLCDSVKQKKNLDVQPYLMTESIDMSQTTVTHAQQKGTKRSRNGKNKMDQNDDDDVKSNASIKSEDEDDQDDHVAKKQRDGQKVKMKSLHIPVDGPCGLSQSHHVFIDTDGTIWDASLNQTNSGANNNKFYRIQLLESNSGGGYRTWTRWGRVGENGQNSWVAEDALDSCKRAFDKKFKDKSGHRWVDRLEDPKKGKYTFIERNYEPESGDEEDGDLPGAGPRRGSKQSTKSDSSGYKVVESALEKPVQQLMELIFNQNYFNITMAEMDYDANKLPLGKLSKRTLMAGYERLKELAELLRMPSIADEQHNMPYAQALEAISNSYYTVIPHSFGRARPPVVADENRLKREIELLESLSDMEIANTLMKEAKQSADGVVHPLDRQYQGLGMSEMTPLDHHSSEFNQLHDYLIKTHGSTHSLIFSVEDIFRITRNGESDRFAQSPYAKLKSKDRRLLWHGSRTTNYGGILSQGLRIAPPEAPASGYMFGKGVYLADVSSKSANYCAASGSGDIGLLLLCEAELGKPMLELTNSDYDAGDTAKKEGKIATWGKGVTAPNGWKDAGVVHKSLKGVSMPDFSKPPGASGVPNAYLQYNEFICYDVAQIRLRYLLRVKMKYAV